MNYWSRRERTHNDEMVYSLMVLVQQGDLRGVKDVVERLNVRLNELDDMGFGAIHYAIMGDHFNVLKYLLEKGADPNLRLKFKEVVPNHLAETPLYLAAEFDKPEAVRLLLDKGANPDIGTYYDMDKYDSYSYLPKPYYTKQKPIDIAKRKKHTEVIHLLEGTRAIAEVVAAPRQAGIVSPILPHGLSMKLNEFIHGVKPKPAAATQSRAPGVQAAATGSQGGKRRPRKSSKTQKRKRNN